MSKKITPWADSLISPLPWTSKAGFECAVPEPTAITNGLVGFAVPIPTFPLGLINKLFAAAFLSTLKAALFPMVNPPVMVEVLVVLVTLSLLIHAVSLTVRYVEEALVMVPPVVVRLVMVPLVDQKLVAVRLVDEALVIVPFVDQKFVAVKLVEEALLKVERLAKVEVPDTVRLPPK